MRGCSGCEGFPHGEEARFPSPRPACGAREFYDVASVTKIEGNMTITTSIDTPKAKIDWTRPVLWLFAVCLIALIVLPLSWLAIYSVTDKANHLTLQYFVTLFTDPDFLDPLLTTAIIAISSAIICCAVAAPMGWLVSRTDMPGRGFIRALVT